ncbi:MAG: phosphoethanolamine transferase, partial [Campylobacter sp.]|nr:phosphoethanolamine transferase [Campylobacter sp.]
ERESKVRVKYALIVVALILISIYLVLGTGRFALFSGVPFFVNVAYLTLSALLFIHLKRLFWLFFVFVLFLAFYAPVGLLYGELTEEFVLAIFGTFANEAGEFAKTFPFKHIAFSLISIILILYFYFTTEKVSLKNRKIIIFLVLFVIITALGQPLKIGTTSTFAKGIRYFKRSLDYMKLVNETKIEPKWQITSVSPKYKNFVVVIGESARRDYFEIYGYTVKNTPFLREINGTFIDGYTATGLNTIPALRHVLSHNADLNLNIVDLANLAGFETSWLSNQGTIGYHDTANTMVAQRANFLYFIGEDKSIKQKSDANLIKKVSEILNNESKNTRVIFLHTYGSHFESCERLTTNEYKKYLDEKTFNINCYVETIAQTDGDLRLLYNILENNRQKTGESFSIIYFSDHGLTHKNNPLKLTMRQNASKEHFAVPLIKISSDDTGRKFIKNESYANYFPQNFARWLGVEVANFSEFSDIFSEVTQKDTLNAKNLVKNPKSDPAIDISKFR